MQTLALGKHNPRIQDVRKAILTANFTSDGLLPVEGPKLIAEAVRSGLEIRELFIRRGAEPEDLPSVAAVYELDTKIFKSIQSTEASQGCVALVRPPVFSLNDILSVAKPLIVVLGRLQDPGNVGTILRVAESFSVSGCLALQGTASVHSPKTIRASAGSVFRLPHVWNLELDFLAGKLRSAGISLIATSPVAEFALDRWSWSRPTAVLIGNEGSGLSDEEFERCEATVRIPHNPVVESLNSAVAAAIIFYEASKHERVAV